MGFKEVSGARQYRGWRDWSDGEYVIGKFKDNGEQESDYGMQQWFDVEVTESNFGLDTNKTLRLNGNGALNPKMDEIALGTEIKIQFDGYDVLTKGKFKGKEFADVKVFVSDSTPVAQTTTETTTDYTGL